MKVLIKERLSPNKYVTHEGYLICKDAILARTGKQQYRKSEVFDTFDGDDDIIDIDRNSKEELISIEILKKYFLMLL